MNRHFGKRLAVHFDSRLLQPVDELTVSNSVLAACSIETSDPKATKFAFLDTAIAKRVSAAANQGLFDRSGQSSAAADIALGAFEESFLFFPSSGTFCGTPRCIPLGWLESGPGVDAPMFRPFNWISECRSMVFRRRSPAEKSIEPRLISCCSR